MVVRSLKQQQLAKFKQSVVGHNFPHNILKPQTNPMIDGKVMALVASFSH